MRNTWTITRREYKKYFISPIAYVTAFFFLALMGYFFFRNLFDASLQGSTPGIQMVLGPLVTFLIFTMPAITMRTISEEYKTGTMELLLTAPVRDAELVVGKWLGGFLFILTLIFVTLIYPILLNNFVSPGIDQSLLITGYFGLILVVSALMAIGVMVSSFTSNQIVAFFVSIFIVFMLWFLQPSAASSNTDFINYLNFLGHYMNFFRGVVDLGDVLYYLSLTALTLFVGTISVETRRWR